MSTWILILFAHVGLMGQGNSNALTSVSGFANQAACETAGAKVKTMADATVKVIKFVCVEQTK